MARSSLSALLKAALAAESTTEGAYILLTISHPSFDAPVRLVRNPTPVTSRGDVFTPFPIDATLPDDVEQNEPSAPLSIDNISREIIVQLRGLADAPTFLLEVVAMSTPDHVETDFPALTCQEIDYDFATISTNLNSAQDPQEPASDFIFSPATFPSLPWVVRTS